MYYLTFTINRQTKNKTVKFAFLPKKRSMYTLTKAPMAHKTFSKEQFKFQVYKCKVSIKSKLINEFKPYSLLQTKVCLVIAKQTFPVLETNLLFLKKCSIFMDTSAYSFYSYYVYISSKLSN